MIDFQSVDVNFGSQRVLAQAGFRVNAGERVGIVGPNGAGKSTLFALLSGELTPDKGEVVMPANCRVGYLHQQIKPSGDDATLLEYAESGMPAVLALQREIERVEQALATQPDDARALQRLGELQTQFETQGGYRLRHGAEAALSGLGFRERDFGNAFTSFSGGWQMRAELARVTVAEPELLMMDEPTNYLDTVAVEWLQRFLRDYAGTLLLISHDRYLLNTLCNVTIEVANGQTTRYAGNYDYYIRERQQRFEQVLSARHKLEQKRAKAERFIERFRANNTKATQVQSKIKMLERMDDVAPMQAIRATGRIRLPDPPRSGHEVARLEGIGHSYNGRDWVLRGVDLTVTRGDKTAVVGLNGAGKTTLLRILAGAIAPTEGRRRLGHNVTAGYQSQDFAELMDPRATVYETLKAASNATERAVRTLLGSFGFSGDAVEKRVDVLSGGEKIRLGFARLLANPPSFLILDEPTTHLDIPARESLEAALRDYTGTLFLVSHDITFVRQVATTVIAMQSPGILRYAGGYDYYREKLAAAGRPAPAPVAAPAPNRPRQDRHARAQVVQKYSVTRRAIKREVDKLEGRIDQLEREQRTLAEQLSNPTAATVHADVNRRLAEIQRQLADTNRRWEAYSIELDELEREYAVARDEAETL